MSKQNKMLTHITIMSKTIELNKENIKHLKCFILNDAYNLITYVSDHIMTINVKSKQSLQTSTNLVV